MFFSYFHYKPHFCLALCFPELYPQPETFPYHLLRGTLCAAVTEINHVYSHVGPSKFSGTCVS